MTTVNRCLSPLYHFVIAIILRSLSSALIFKCLLGLCPCSSLWTNSTTKVPSRQLPITVITQRNTSPQVHIASTPYGYERSQLNCPRNTTEILNSQESPPCQIVGRTHQQNRNAVPPSNSTRSSILSNQQVSNLNLDQVSPAGLKRFIFDESTQGKFVPSITHSYYQIPSRLRILVTSQVISSALYGQAFLPSIAGTRINRTPRNQRITVLIFVPARISTVVGGTYSSFTSGHYIPYLHLATRNLLGRGRYSSYQNRRTQYTKRKGYSSCPSSSFVGAIYSFGSFQHLGLSTVLLRLIQSIQFTMSTVKPELASSQLSFTTSDALVGLSNAPSYSYTILVFLRCRSGTNFSKVAYTEQVRHFVGVCKTGDPDFLILKKRQTARSNAITRQEEVPSNTLEFEEDFARDVSLDKQHHWVRFRISVASSKKFFQLFRDDNFKTYKLIRKFRWHVDVTSLDHDCYMVHIGWFKYLHPVFTNRDDLKKDFDTYFGHLIKEYDFTSRYERRNYTTMREDGTEKKDTCHIRVISMYVPVDIAYSASRSIVEYWGNELMEERQKSRDPTQPTNRLLLCEFIPNSTKLLPSEDQIQHLLDQGQYLTDFKDAVYIYNCITIDGQFRCTEAIATAANAEKFKDQDINIRKILLSWVDHDSQETIVKLIEQMSHSRYAIVAHMNVISEVRKVLHATLDVIKDELGDEEYRLLGGDIDDGMRVDDPKGLLQPQRARSYLDRLQHSTHYVKVGTRRYTQSQPKRPCVATDTSNSQVQRLYSDVIVPAKPTTSTSLVSGSTTSLVLSTQDGNNRQLSTIEDFNALVKQQVEKVIAPSLAKLNTTINTVQQATSRVEKLEHQTKQVQQKQDELSNTMTKSMHDLTGIMQENLRIIRSESQSMQSTHNDQFKQLMHMLQSNAQGTSVHTTTTEPSQLSSLTNSAASIAASSSSTPIPSTPPKPSKPIRKSSPGKRKHTDNDDTDGMDMSPSFDDALSKHIEQEEFGPHKSSSLVTGKSPHPAENGDVEGRGS